MKKHIITLTGNLGSGKSTAAKKLAEQLDYPRFYAGQIMRDESIKRGMDFPEFQKEMSKNPDMDTFVDDRIKEILEKGENAVVESRTAFAFDTDSFHVFVAVDPHEGARRILHDMQTNPNRQVEVAETIEEVLASVEQRVTSERLRYEKLHGIVDHFDQSKFDFIVDSTNKNPEQVVHTIIEAYKTWLSLDN
ncbi:MAG: AAA family ATPase [Candidatus Nomurabacteria bacterium]|nr:AAA family ATPase [Candidatus Nomurabacteria bacterium]